MGKNLKYPAVQDGERVFPTQNGAYMMKCCDCGLVHRMQIRAVEITKYNADGSFHFKYADPDEHMVEIRAWRVES